MNTSDKLDLLLEISNRLEMKINDLSERVAQFELRPDLSIAVDEIKRLVLDTQAIAINATITEE